MLGLLFGRLTDEARCFRFLGLGDSLLLKPDPGRSDRARDFELALEEWPDAAERVGLTSLNDSLLCSRFF